MPIEPRTCIFRQLSHYLPVGMPTILSMRAYLELRQLYRTMTNPVGSTHENSARCTERTSKEVMNSPDPRNRIADVLNLWICPVETLRRLQDANEDTSASLYPAHLGCHIWPDSDRQQIKVSRESRVWNVRVWFIVLNA